MFGMRSLDRIQRIVVSLSANNQKRGPENFQEVIQLLLFRNRKQVTVQKSVGKFTITRLDVLTKSGNSLRSFPSSFLLQGICNKSPSSSRPTFRILEPKHCRKRVYPTEISSSKSGNRPRSFFQWPLRSGLTSGRCQWLISGCPKDELQVECTRNGH